MPRTANPQARVYFVHNVNVEWWDGQAFDYLNRAKGDTETALMNLPPNISQDICITELRIANAQQFIALLINGNPAHLIAKEMDNEAVLKYLVTSKTCGNCASCKAVYGQQFLFVNKAQISVCMYRKVRFERC